MPIMSIERPSYLIIDNSVLSMLTEWHCAENMRTQPTQLLAQTQQWLLDAIEIMRPHAVENVLYTSNLVSVEFKPDKGHLGSCGLATAQIGAMANAVRAQLKEIVVDASHLPVLRGIPNANKRLVHPKDGLSDPDLSLLHLGLQLTQYGQPVVILSNDQDLLDFTTWARIQKPLKTGTINPLLLESETGLGFLELLHRSCSISSDKMRKMINYLINDTMGRMQPKADGTQLSLQKAMKIVNKVTSINDLFAKAVEIKAENRRMAA